jgi:hypothetical protein
MSTKVYAPNIHLFAFHLKDSNQPNLLWDKCNYLLSQKFGVTKPLEIEEHEGYRVDLLKDKTLDDVSLQFESTVYQHGTSLPIAGFATPLRIHDSYVLTLNLRRPEFDENQKKTNPVELNFLKLLNPSGFLMPNEMGTSLGQTILLTVWYTPDKQWLPWKLSQNRQQLRELADKCLREFIPNNYARPDFNQEGQLFGSPIFEYAIPIQDKDYCHVLVWVYCESETSENFVVSYNSFVNLFYYLNKTVAAYRRSRKVYQVLSKEYKDIEGYVDEISQEMFVNTTLNEEKLKKLKEYLKIIPLKLIDYLKFIRELDLYRLPIDINAQNYKQELRDIQNQFPTEDLSFLYRFYEEYFRLFNEQIQSEIVYFTHGIGLLEKTLTAIKIRVEIEQAESDRANESAAQKRQQRLERLIAFVSTALAVSGITSQVAPNPVKTFLTKPVADKSSDIPELSSYLSYSSLEVLIHVLIGVLLAIPVYFLVKCRQRQKTGKTI